MRLHAAFCRRTGTTPLVILLGLLVAGCARGGAEPATPRGPSAASVTVSMDRMPNDEAGRANVSLSSADEAALARLVAAHRGQVVLVDFWATWCLPCVELFPHTVELHHRFADRGLAVISVSFDDPANEPAVRRFLAEKGATFDNLLSPYGIASKAWDAFGIEDGVLPHIQIYDRAGNVSKTFGATSGTFTAEDVDRAVDQLLHQL